MSKSLQNLSDEDLYRLIKGDDRAAFAELYERFKRPLLAFALKKLSADEAEDIVHDLLTKLWDNRYVIVIQRQFTSYVFGALRNRVIDHMMKSQRSQDYIESVKSYALESRFTDRADYKMREADFIKVIERTLNEFSPKAHMIIRLRMEGYNNHEIAERLNLSEKTIRNQQSEIIKYLRKKLPTVMFIAGVNFLFAMLMM